MSDNDVEIMGAIGRLQSSVDSLMHQQRRLFELTDSFQTRTATLEAEQKDASRRVLNTERAIGEHNKELAEARGSAKSNRWLTIALPPAFLVIWEIGWRIFDGGSKHIGG